MRSLLGLAMDGVPSAWLFCICAAACAPCGDAREREPEPETAPAEPSPPVAPPRAIATAASFDLVASGSGALLVWGAPDAKLSVVALDAVGSARGDARVLFEDASAVEIAAATGGGRLGLVWVSDAGDAHVVMSTHGPATAEALAPPIALGEIHGVEVGARGLIAAAAAEDGNIAVMHRERDAPCPPGTGSGGADETCAQFDIHRLGGATERRGVGLVTPDPCTRGAVGYVWTAGVWYYGVCTRPAGAPVTTVYAIQFEPQYAHAEAVLEGCEPLGIAPGEAGAVVVGRCGGALEVVSLTEAAQRRADVHRARPRITCVDARPRLELAGAGGTIARTLSAPESRFEAMLPPDIAPPGSRAVWTGDALLVARPAPRDLAFEVSLGRYQCVGGGLTRTDQT